MVQAGEGELLGASLLGAFCTEPPWLQKLLTVPLGSHTGKVFGLTQITDDRYLIRSIRFGMDAFDS